MITVHPIMQIHMFLKTSVVTHLCKIIGLKQLLFHPAHSPGQKDAGPKPREMTRQNDLEFDALIIKYFLNS
jgi:hypothetical protein